MKMLIIKLSLTLLSAWVTECAVLDPALYLLPSPPLAPTSDGMLPEELWLQSLETRNERVAKEVAENTEATQQKPVAVSGRMFWPRLSSPPTLGISIPLTFSLSGSYGKPASPTGVIGNTYTSIAGFSSNLGSSNLGKTSAFSPASVYGNYGRTALAGSGYGTYGAPSVRIYGGDSAASWSGWGNGKWGHYGKG